MKVEEELTLKIDMIKIQLKDCFEEKNLLLEENEKFRKVLDFYANENNWEDGKCLVNGMNYDGVMVNDNGYLAREVLGKK